VPHEYLHTGSFHHPGTCRSIVCKEKPVMSRTLEIRGDQTLAKLHEIIFKTFDRFDEYLYEFQDGGKRSQ
jgi:hypothetical protein